jgi:hypothetical protein
MGHSFGRLEILETGHKYSMENMHDKIMEAFGQDFISELAFQHGIAWPIVSQDNNMHGWVETDGCWQDDPQYTVTDIPSNNTEAACRLISILSERYAQNPDTLNRLSIGFGQAEVDARFGPTWTHGIYIDIR